MKEGLIINEVMKYGMIKKMQEKKEKRGKKNVILKIEVEEEMDILIFYIVLDDLIE